MICITFTEPVTVASATATSHYSIDHSIIIDTASLTTPETVCLNLDPLTPLSSGVTYTVILSGIMDLCGNPMEGSFQFTCPFTNCISIACSDIVTNSCTNLWIYFHPTVTSLCCANPSVVCTPSSGSVFAPGSFTTVTCTADDHCGHTATCAFSVIVNARRPLNFYNTGVNDFHQLLSPGSADPHYELLLNPSGTGTQPKVVQNNYLFGAWMANDAVSQWIGPKVDGTGAYYTNYHYRLTFRVCCTNDVIIHGQWAVDNAAAMLLNGNPTPVATLPGEVWNNFAKWHPFSINSGFVQGQNTLDFWVTNYSAYTGLRVAFGDSFECCSNALQIVCPADIVTNSCTNVLVFYTPIVTNLCCTNVTITCNPPSPSWFAPGTTTLVTCTASDSCGNTTNCSFTVTVNARHPFDVYNTGMDSNHQWLPDGTADPHYELLTPSGMNVQSVVVKHNLKPSLWLANDPNSQWLGAQPDGFGDVGTYRFRFWFKVCCTNDVLLSGQWAVDNAGAILLNGQPVPGGSIPGHSLDNFGTWHSFSISSGFILGQNSLDFYVTNFEDWIGLRVEFLEAFECCSNKLQIICPEDIVASTWGPPVLVSYHPTVTNACCTNVTIICNPPSPGPFAVGATLITCTARDDCGNTVTCQFMVTVNKNSIHIDPVPIDGRFNLHWPTNEGWILQKAPTVNGEWVDITSAIPPFTIQPTGTNQYYRLKKP